MGRKRIKRTHGMVRKWEDGCRCKKCIEAFREYKRQMYRRHKDSQRNTELKRLYGITLAEFRALVRAQLGRCIICRKSLWYKLHTDHCHTSGKVRGLLCFRCNTKLGWYEEFNSRIKRYLNGEHIHSVRIHTL